MLDWKIEVVQIPVADIDRAKEFYSERLGFVVDLDHQVNDQVRLVQLTPPGSGCSIHLSTGIHQMKPGSIEAIQIVVPDIEAARAELVTRGADVSAIRHVDLATGAWSDGKGGDWNSFVFFSDPDGNSWVVQERPAAK
jgi:catechol 2,3-dioxygenase-like lactoylglutathione lyase family enzyme